MIYEQPRASIGDTFAGGEATVGEIYAAAREQMLYVDNSFATNWAFDRAISERNDEVFAATGVKLDHPFRRDYRSAGDTVDGQIVPRERFRPRLLPQTRAERHAREIEDWQRQIAEAAARIPDQSVADRLNRSIEGDAIRIARESDERLARLMESRPGAGKWTGAFAGALSGSLRDPIAVGTLMLGGGSGAARTVAGRIAATAAREAFVNGATEAAMQPLVQAWREKAGLDHGMVAALTNIGFAAAFGGVLGGAGQAVGEGAAKLTGRALAAAGDVAAADPRVAEPLRRAMAGDIDAAAMALPEIRDALPAGARGALDQAEVLAHAEKLRPAGASVAADAAAIAAAHRAIDQGAPAAFAVDEDQVRRVVGAIAGEEVAAETGRKAVSLIEFLKAKGGVKDFSGELRAIGAEDLARRRGRRDRRMSLDYAREAAEEAGYLGRDGETQVSTVADLLDAIDRERRGQPVHARGDVPEPYDMQRQQAAVARLESTVAEIAGYAGPAVDDAIIREAAEISMAEAIDPFDALERVLVRAESNETRAAARAARSGEPLPGWSDAELDAASAGRGLEPAGGFFADPADYPDDYAISPAELKQFAEVAMPGDDGRVVSLERYMEQIKAEDDLATIVKACRA